MAPYRPELRTLRVARIGRPADRVVALDLVDPAGTDLPPWCAGAHLDVVLPSGLIRQYSLYGDPDDRATYRVAVLLETNGRGGSREIHETDLTGREILVRGPRNHFELVSAPRYLFIAGGIGVTPLLAQAREAHRAGAEWVFAYGGRSRSSMALVPLVDELAEAGRGEVRLFPEDEVGLMPVEELVADSPDALIYCCGPEALIAAVEAVSDRNSRRDDLHVERFSAPAAARPDATEADDGFEVELRSSGEVLWVPPSRTILEVVREACPDLLSSCEEGFCGSCEVGVIAGVPDHRDTILTEEEQNKSEYMMICVGRSKSPRLVLDL